MEDPIGAFDRVRESLILYVRTAFSTQFTGLELERERLLTRPGLISQEPRIEPLPHYETSGKPISDLIAEDRPRLHSQTVEDFRALASAGLLGTFRLHRHQ